MEKIKDMDGLRKSIGAAFDGFEKGYCRYFGMGNHLYILVSDFNEEIEEAGNQQIHPSVMLEQLKEFKEQIRIIRVDSEMGGIDVYERKNIS